MPDPVRVLEALRGLLAENGALIVMDERASESFEAPADDIQRLLYGYSVLHCLPVGMSDQPSVGTGTVLRPSTMRAYAAEAGFSGVEILPIEHDSWRSRSGWIDAVATTRVPVTGDARDGRGATADRRRARRR